MRRSDPQFRTLFTVAAMALVALPVRVLAAPLEPEICQNLAVQRDALEARGVRQLIGSGPPQARAQLSSDQIAHVRQLMDLDGQLRFRCPLDKPVAALKEDPPEEQADAATDGAAVVPAKPASAAVKRVPPVKVDKAPAKAVKAATAPVVTQDAPTTPKAAPVKSAPKRATNPRVDDAYRAPAAQPDSGATVKQ